MVLSVYFSFSFFLFSVIPLCSASSGECPPSFDCGDLGGLGFPLTTPQLKHCGVLPIHGCTEHHNAQKTVYFGQKQFQVTGYDPVWGVRVRDKVLEKLLANGSCDVLSWNITLPPSSPLGSLYISSNITMYKCNRLLNSSLPKQFLKYTGCSKSHNQTIFFGTQDQDDPPPSIATCPRVQVPVSTRAFSADPFTFIASEFWISFQVSDDCSRCPSGTRCLLNSTGGIYCFEFKEDQNKTLGWKLGLIMGCGKSNNETIFFGTKDQDDPPTSLAICPRVQLPVNMLAFSADPFTFVVSEFSVDILLSDDCDRCSNRKGICLLDGKGAFQCSESKGGAIGSFGVVIIGLTVILLRNKRKHKSSGSQNQSSSIESKNTNSNAILESRNVYLMKQQTDLINQDNLEEEALELFIMLKDGREVAVKRPFEQNHRGEQQFINEVQILTRLRHKNLVSLYGCTSRASRELLLVYEYISNGTLGCHLHGNLAKPASLPWPVRMRIAIETANALTYLHACGIIHRDVKSSNLLLDHHFCVKVADFGISRLFPMFVSHVSTAPAGTPGYLDPGYYQYCQLTEKSDVYSFGVILIELISSKPAIFTRDKEKINLANLAVDQIQRGAFSELVDPSLGFESDDKVREIIISVARLAFWCLQRDVDPRPSMAEVTEFLQKIENGKEEIKHLEFHGAWFSNMETYTSLPTSVHRDGAALLNNSRPQHPPPTV